MSHISQDSSSQEFSQTPFWGKSPHILTEQATEWYPRGDMSSARQWNALTRGCIYISVLIAVYRRSTIPLLYGAILLLAIYLVYQVTKGNPIFKGPTPKPTHKWQHPTPALPRRKRRKTTQWKAPTRDNPFMNTLPMSMDEDPEAELADPERSYDDIQKHAEEAFSQGLYRDFSDVFGKASSQRQFYTLPNTAKANRQDEFAHWLYGGGTSPPPAPFRVFNAKAFQPGYLRGDA
jgi:hypothetical protein